MERTSRRGRMLGAMLMVVGALTLFMAGTAGATHVDPVLNPDDNDNPSCEDLGYDIEAKFDATGNAGDSDTASGDGLVVNWTFNEDGTIDFEVDETSEYWVAAAIVKQSADSGPNPGGANVYEYDPAVESDTGLVDPRGDSQFSHITFCGGEIPPPPASLTITKALTPESEVTDWSIEFTGPDGSFTLTDEAPSTTLSDLEAGDYTVTEATSEDYTLEDVDCGDATTVDVDGGVTVTLAAGDDVTCEFTNDFPEVEETVVVNTPEEPEEEAVLGEQVTRTPAAQPAQVEQLAFTGSGTERLAVAGLAMVLLGTVLVLGDRRRRAEV